MGMAEDKKEKVAKNELQRLRNLARATTASLGKFQESLHKKLEKTAQTKGKKRKFESNTVDNSTEKERSLNILQSITNKSSKIDIDAAVNKQIFREDQERKTKKRKRGREKRRARAKESETKAHFKRKG